MNGKPLSLIVAAVLAGFAVTGAAADPAGPASEPEKNGYSVGYDLGRAIKRQLVGIDPGATAQGLRDALSGAAAALPEPEMQQRFLAVRQESAQRIPERNRAEGEAFLARNKGEKGVKTTASGLQYRVITAGKGRRPTAEDTVTVNYRGTLIDGTEFDSSYRRGQPATFPVKGVIAGWTEALQLMNTGARWMLYIPANLAYGERGAGPQIGPNSTLVFEVELLSIAAPGEN